MQNVDILVVEDERIIALDLQDQLVGLGYSVPAIVSNGADAMRLAEQLRPTIVLMDVFIEGDMDGIETAEELYRRFRIPVVFLTAYSGEQLLERATGTMPFGYLLKPFETRELHATLQVALARRNAEIALERSEQRLALALRSSDLAVFEWDVDSGRVDIHGVVPAIARAFTPTKPARWDDLVARILPGDRPVLARAVGSALRDGGHVSLHLRTLEPWAQVGWIEFAADAHPAGPAGGPRLIGTLRDIGERRRAEERLHQAGVVYDTIAEAIMIVDREGRVVSVNPAFRELTGFDEEDIAGNPVDYFLKARRHADAAILQDVDAGGTRWKGEGHCRRKDGSIFPVWQSVGVVRDMDGIATHYVVALSDISALRKIEEDLEYLAHHDVLTGLPNRHRLTLLIDQQLSSAARSGGACAVVFLDLDGFKPINDSRGHAVGDLILTTLARRIRQALRSTDVAARWGGDEFVLVLGEIGSPRDAAHSIAKLLRLLAEPIDSEPGEPVVVTASAGIALGPGDELDAEALLRLADSAMYRAKSRGPGRLAFHDPRFGVTGA